MKKWKKKKRPPQNLPRNLPILFLKDQEYTQKKGGFRILARPGWEYWAINDEHTIQKSTALEQVPEHVLKQFEETEEIPKVQ